MPALNFGFNFENLNSLSGLARLDESFLRYVSDYDPTLCTKLQSYRETNLAGIEKQEYSKFLMQLAPILDDFISELFNITEENLAAKKEHEKFNVVYECRRKFIQRYVLKKYPKEALTALDFKHISYELKNLLSVITEQSISESVLSWQANPEKYSRQLDIAAMYCAFMVHNHSSLMLFDVPMPKEHIRRRRIEQLRQNIHLGFDYQDQEHSLDKAAAHAKYCIYCHKQEKDSCSHGIPESNKKGCPLKQKISEMNLLKAQGLNIAALGVIVIDNPLVAATGHRICNDCMQACIYQKQDPVNIPLVETNILEQVLSLPWGTEIYLLLSKWNPLNIDAPLPKPTSGYNILIAGLGPAGFALSHYLLNEGHNITAIDGLKISPLHFDIKQPVKYWQDVKLTLSEKTPQGFGGVAEYGITNRWDKNNLSLVRLMLERRNTFKMHGGVRLGSNITWAQAFDAGFDHIALCLGAGRPRFMNSSDYFAKGVRSAADFLMNLQQGGSYIPGSNSNLLIRMPSVVIGCGLTAIDSAVQLLHYYPVQVENFYRKWIKQDNPAQDLNDEDKEIAKEFITHAKLFQAAKNDAEKLQILDQIGGVTICYRKTIKESTAYRLNCEEIEHAMAIGVKFEELLIPETVHADRYGSAKAITFFRDKLIEAKSVLVAIGTENNKFQDIDNLDEDQSDIFKSKDSKISYFGDCNQKYAGSVVAALASAKNGYQAISKSLAYAAPKTLKTIDDKLKSHVHRVNILSDHIVEIIIHSPFCAQNFRPGQFFRLQNHSSDSSQVMEPLALTGAHVDKKTNLISLIVLEVGRSSRLCRKLQAGQEVVLMGPTGMPTTLARDKKVVLIGSGLGNAVLMPIAEGLKENNCHVTYFAGYRKPEDRFYHEQIKQASDQVIWACEKAPLSTTRENDLSIKGNIIDGIIHAQKAGLIDKIDQIICIGSDHMMQAVASRKQELFGNAEMICSINSPMQCMMKGICGQCVQKVNDERGYIFSCACQDQNADIIDFDALNNRLRQNSLLEKSL